VLLTGANGFIGAHASSALSRRGFEVHAVTSRSPDGAHLPSGEITWHSADLLDPAAGAALVERVAPTHLLHLAWYTEHGAFWTSSANVAWVEASLRLLAAFVEGGGERAVLAGTCAEYDWSEGGRLAEDRSPLAPATLYGTCKHALHLVAEALARQSGVELAWGRVFLLFGPGEPAGRLVPSVIGALLAGHPAPCSHGRQMRDFLYSADVADAFAALLDSRVQGAVNIGSGEPVAIAEVVRLLGELCGRPELIELGALAARPEEPDLLVADTRRLRKEVVWTPRLTLAEALRDTVRWWRERMT
jgi:nucleoside-diphosphate-sugar epimerase